MKDYLTFLYAYNSWANRRVLETCARLTQDEFLRGEGSSTANPSIRDTLVHTMGAHELWLARWGGVSPMQRLNPKDFGTPALISEYWDEIEEHTRGFLNAVEEDVLQGVMHYKNTIGEPFSYPMWWTLVHQVNHATQHRSEVALLLTQANHSPGELDVLGYAHELKAG